MREYEFNGVDVITEMLKFRKHCKNKQITLSEHIAQDRQYVQNFVNAANSLSVEESDLIKGNYYCPMTMQVEYSTNALLIIIAVNIAQYLGSTGSRLQFKYDSCDFPMNFPSDDGLISDSYRFVFSSKTDLDNIVTQLIIQFKGSDRWTLSAKGFTETGVLSTISNI